MKAKTRMSANVPCIRSRQVAHEGRLIRPLDITQPAETKHRMTLGARSRDLSQSVKRTHRPSSLPFRAILSVAGVIMIVVIALPILPKSARAQEPATVEQEEGGVSMQENSFKVTILYNNVPHDNRLTTAWGMACLVEGGPKTVLFDTGGDGSILLENMKTLEKNPEDVDVVHTGGLAAFLEENSNVEVFLPASFPASLKEETARTGAEVREVSGPRQIMEGIHTTGEMGTLLKEQALILDTANGLVLITGCSHPGVDNMAQQTVKICPDRKFYLITGGFHLGGTSAASIQKIIRTFRTLEVQKVGPSHCTGDEAIRMFREAWGKDFVDLGCGAQVTIPRKQEQTEGTKR